MRAASRRGSALDLLNLLALLLALGLAMAGSGLIRGGSPDASARGSMPASSALSPRRERLPDGRPALRDARSVLVPLLDYRRIASATLIADRVLADLCEPERIVAFSRYAENTPGRHRYAGKPTLGARDEVEAVLALKPELLIVSDLVDPSYIARVEEHGVRVFELGKMQGLSSLLPDIQALGQLIGAPERAEAYARALSRRLTNLAHDVRKTDRPRALYLSIYGDKLFAAAASTSYHDVIEFAGLTDAAAAAGLQNWPELTGERVLTLDPDVLLTRTGMAALLCRHPGLELLRACRVERAAHASSSTSEPARERIIELDGALLDDPGPAMLEAAEALHDAYWSR